jgi:hypothetical protein
MKNAPTLLVSCCLVAACGDAPQSGEAQPEAAMIADATVTIAQPMAGSDVMGSAVTVRLRVTGVSIVPAGDLTPLSGHHHLYLDADLTAAGEPVPSVPGSIVHMGDASSEFTFEDVGPGEHRLIAVVANGVHMPLQPWVIDTVTFTVR